MVSRVSVVCLVVPLAVGCGGKSERFDAGGSAAGATTTPGSGAATTSTPGSGAATTTPATAAPGGSGSPAPEQSFGRGGAGTIPEPSPSESGDADPNQLIGAAGYTGDAGGYTGSAGGYTSGSAGYAGAAVTTDCTQPSVTDELTPWQAPTLPTDLKAILLRAAAGMVGDWYGIVTTPWTEPYQVSLTFTDDGYSAKCDWNSDQCCEAFYYGTDLDSSLKRYSVNRVTIDGVVGGDLDVIFDIDGTFYESGYQGSLEKIELDATGTRLRFDFMYGGTYGPVEYDLERRPTSLK